MVTSLVTGKVGPVEYPDVIPWLPLARLMMLLEAQAA